MMINLYDIINKIEPISKEQYKWLIDVLASGRP